MWRERRTSMPERKQRLHVRLTGVVQGVGFRPFVHRLAGELRLAGWCRNFPGGVELEVEGCRESLSSFLLRLEKDGPVHSVIYNLEPRWLPVTGKKGFEILESEREDVSTLPMILPDLAPCPECLREIHDQNERRYFYPFTNCTHCGPRYTIMAGVPYDRKCTSMRGFSLCPDCSGEYGNPADRRFHAQPIACPVCGPELYMLDSAGVEMDRGRKSGDVKRMLERASSILHSGNILALMGVGGVQLLVDACNEEAVCRLRTRKAREGKPLAIMVSDGESARQMAVVGEMEERLLKSSASPIVLLRRKEGKVAPSVALFSPWMGVMLPSSPLHCLLMDTCGGPLVVTSGNLSGEPMCVTREEAVVRLAGIADAFLLHTRPIVRSVDDSVVRVVCGREMLVRRARGYAPLPVRINNSIGRERGAASILGTGGLLKNALALYGKGVCVPGQHIGDMEMEPSFMAYQKTYEDLVSLLKMEPEFVAVDAHPDYYVSQWGRKEAKTRGLPVVEVQHHVAHVLSCMAENETVFPALGVAWDGTGYGPDGTVWGGEFFLMEKTGWRRRACWLPFRLPGNERAVREPARVAISLLSQMAEEECPLLRRRVVAAFSRRDGDLIDKMLRHEVNSPWTSSMGRLFDAAAFLLGFDGEIRCEGQAAMTLEGWAWLGLEEKATEDCGLPDCEFGERNGLVLLDWRPLFRGMEVLLERGISRCRVAYEFHAALAGIIVTMAGRFAMNRVAVGGGCFQNGLLLELLSVASEKAGVELAFPQRVPAHDGGLALGQISAVLHQYLPE